MIFALVLSIGANSAPSCTQWCEAQNAGVGNIIGTAPTCEANCYDDCNGACTVGGVGEFSDYGSGCWTGNKICCCQKKSARSARSLAMDAAGTKLGSKLDHLLDMLEGQIARKHVHDREARGGCPFDWGKCSALGRGCDMLLGGSPVRTVKACLERDAEVTATCEVVGAGPEDPIADTCAGIFDSVFTVKCVAAVAKEATGKFTTSACKSAVGCGCLNGGRRMDTQM